MALRSHISDNRGFTLVELLVVIAIVGILSAIALPAFINQRAKGFDTEARAMLRTTAIALNTHQTAEDTFDATRAELEQIEPTLDEARSLTHAGTVNTFTASEISASGTTFSIERFADGSVLKTCSAHGRGLCRSSADGGGNWW